MYYDSRIKRPFFRENLTFQFSYSEKNSKFTLLPPLILLQSYNQPPRLYPPHSLFARCIIEDIMSPCASHTAVNEFRVAARCPNPEVEYHSTFWLGAYNISLATRIYQGLRGWSWLLGEQRKWRILQAESQAWCLLTLMPIFLMSRIKLPASSKRLLFSLASRRNLVTRLSR